MYYTEDLSFLKGRKTISVPELMIRMNIGYAEAVKKISKFLECDWIKECPADSVDYPVISATTRFRELSEKEIASIVEEIYSREINRVCHSFLVNMLEQYFLTIAGSEELARKRFKNVVDFFYNMGIITFYNDRYRLNVSFSCAKKLIVGIERYKKAEEEDTDSELEDAIEFLDSLFDDDD